MNKTSPLLQQALGRWTIVIFPMLAQMATLPMWMAGRAILTATVPTCCAVSRGRNARRGECSIRTIRAAALAALPL